MNEWQTMLSAVASVFLVIGAGAFARGMDLLTEEADRTLVRLTIWMLYPLLILDTMGGNQKLFTSSSIIVAPLLGYALPVVGCAVAYLVLKLTGKWLPLEGHPQRATFIVASGLFNYGYIPIPLTQQIFPDDAATLSNLFLHNAGVEFAIWTVAVSILAGKTASKRLPRESIILFVTIVIAMVLNYTHLWQKRPMWLGDAVHMLAMMALPTQLLLSGAMIADVWKQAQFRSASKTIAAALGIRMLVMPALFVALAVILPVSTGLKRVLVIQSAMPSAVFSIVLGRHFGGDVATAVRIVISTSIIALATIPLWLWIGFKLIGL